MNRIRLLLAAFFLAALTACGSNPCLDGKIIPGTDSTVVQVAYFEKNKKIVVSNEVAKTKPGHRVVIVGPDDMQIRLKENEIIDQELFQAEDGVVIIPIPPEKAAAIIKRTGKPIKIKYDVLTHGVELDPYIAIEPK